MAAVPELRLPALHDILAQRSGCEIQVRDYPTARVWKEFSAGQLDVVIGALRTPDRDALADFVVAATWPWVLVTAMPQDQIPRRLEDFTAQPTLRVGAIRGGAYPRDLAAVIDALRRQGQFDESTDLAMAVNKMRAGRDAAVLTTTITYALLPAGVRDPDFRLLQQDQFTASPVGNYFSRVALNSSDLKLLVDSMKAVQGSGISGALLRFHLPQIPRPLPPPPQ